MTLLGMGPGRGGGVEVGGDRDLGPRPCEGVEG